MNPFMDDDDSLIDIEDFHSVEVDLEILDHQEGRSVNFLEDIGLLKEIKKLSLYDNHNLDDILSGYEKANVDIPTGYLTFREVFAKMLLDKKMKKGLVKKDVDDGYAFDISGEGDAGLRPLLVPSSNQIPSKILGAAH